MGGRSAHACGPSDSVAPNATRRAAANGNGETMRRNLAAVIVSLCAVGALAAGCSSNSDSSASSTTTSATSTTVATSPTTTDDSGTVWLCRPDLADNPCTEDLTTTVITAAGTSSVAQEKPTPDPPIDCFYVYPTVSQEKTPNSDLVIGDDERNVAIAQASPFSRVCKVYAPMYRQATLASILGSAEGTPDREAAYDDVRNAWQEYLEKDNHDRGVVLIGHSQGTFVLTKLVSEEIDAQPDVRKLLVSALLIGGNVTVADGSDTGGSFENVPACRSTDQTGCVVAYSAFAEAPPADALFGRTKEAGQHVLCVNPAGLGDGNGMLAPEFPTFASLLGSGLENMPTDLTTPWVSFPSLYKAHCETGDGASWLQIDDVRRTGDDRPKLVQGLGPTWGLHLVDMNAAMGNLVALTRSQGAAWNN